MVVSVHAFWISLHLFMLLTLGSVIWVRYRQCSSFHNHLTNSPFFCLLKRLTAEACGKVLTGLGRLLPVVVSDTLRAGPNAWLLPSPFQEHQTQKGEVIHAVMYFWLLKSFFWDYEHNNISKK